MEINIKEILIKPLPAKIANEFVKAHHYSGKVVNNSCLHFGAFYNNILHGVLSFGPSMDKSKIIPLVKDTKWNDYLELNRMAFDDFLPKNSESRCISICFKLIKKHYPNIKWIVSFADGCSCGDGTIYRASGFVLTGITKNKTIIQFPNGKQFANLVLTGLWRTEAVKQLCKDLGVPHKYYTMTEWHELGAKELEGYMFRYIYFLDKSYQSKLTVPIIPFCKIDELNAGMYKGEKIKLAERHK